jgi:PAS domain S-box-containing protein
VKEPYFLFLLRLWSPSLKGLEMKDIDKTREELIQELKYWRSQVLEGKASENQEKVEAGELALIKDWLQQREKEFESLLSVAHIALQNTSFETTARLLFEESKVHTGATAGYVALLSESGDENEVLFLDSGGGKCTVDPSLPMPIRGLRELAYRHGKTVHDNDFEHSEWKKFLPHGHIKMRNVMFAPLQIDGKIVGVMGLANKKGDFGVEDNRIASAFGDMAALALKNSRSIDAVKESEERFSKFFRSSPIGTSISLLSDGQFLDANDTFIGLFGYTREEVIGQNLFKLKMWANSEDRAKMIETLQEKGRVREFETRFRKKSGEIMDVLVSAEVMELTGQQYILGLTHDITDRKLAEAERARLEAENRQLQKAESLGRMAGAVAHLFNNHLAAVIGNLELAMMDLPGDAVNRKNMLEAMLAARRSAEISGLMLTYLGQTTDKGEPLDLSEVCRQNLSMLRDTMPESIALKTDFLSYGPIVRANANKVLQVLTHLITNGWESMGHSQGTVTLATRIIPASEIPRSRLAPVDWKPADGVFSCLEVTDTGCGMAEEDIDKIFDPFYTTKFTGRGLGLAVVLGMVKTWGGAIGVESKKNHGSIFRVFLPLATGELPRASEKATEVHQMEQGGMVLLVEDQDMVRKMAESMLKRMGHEVLAASGGAEAVKLFEENQDQICCVITDLTMPGMDGWETLTAVRKIRPQIAVILASGHDEAHALGRDYTEQPNVFLHKPYSMSDFKSAIDKALKKAVSKT